MLLKERGFTAVAILALALGIGANTAIFSIVNAVVLRPLPYNDPEKLVKVWTRFVGIGLPNDRNWVSGPELIDLKRQDESFSSIAAFRGASFNITGGGTPERVEGAAVSAALFDVLGVQARIGRVFLPEEEEPGKENVVLLGHGLWQRRFGGDSTLPGKILTINGRQFLVAGVMPPGFAFPAEAEMWMPLALTPEQLSENARGGHGLQVLARLKPDLTIEQARSNLQAIALRMIEQHKNYPYAKYNFTWIATPLLEEIVGDIKPALMILMGAVGFVLLIACANVANLLLARASVRQREIALRTALGAGRGRLVRQLLTESLVLSLAGAIAGLLIAWGSISVLTSLAAETFPRAAEAKLDGTVLGFTLLISVLTAVVFGLLPALQSSRGVKHDSLKEGGRGSSSGAAPLQMRRMFVIAEVALALVLLVGAGLLIKSFLRLQQVDGGFRPDGVFTMRVSLPQALYSEPVKVRGFYNQAIARMERVPGVEAVGAVSALPLSGTGFSGTVTIDTSHVPPEDASPEADQTIVTPNYFRAMRIQLLSGRYFDERDHESAPPVAIIDESLANTYWPGESAVGKRIKRGGAQSTNPWMTIVGVVRHVRIRSLELQSRVQLYWPHAQLPSPALTFAVRTSTDPASYAPALQKQVLAVDPEQPVYGVRTMQELLAESLARRRLVLVLFFLFAGVAMLLAAVGIYGILSYMVAQRSHEMGIRMALGASPGDVQRLIMGQSLSLTMAGVVLGLGGALALTGFMTSLLFNVKPGDPFTLILVAVLLSAVALAASFVPARRATQVDPMHALRQE
jgi:putative ABC transport system permease protein